MKEPKSHVAQFQEGQVDKEPCSSVSKGLRGSVLKNLTTPKSKVAHFEQLNNPKRHNSLEAKKLNFWSSAPQKAE